MLIIMISAVYYGISAHPVFPDAVAADELRGEDLAAGDTNCVAALTVDIVGHTMQLNYTYQEAPPPTLIEVQSVPMGMFKPQTSTPSRDNSTPKRELELISLEFWTFWQHCGVPVN
jgi:hypothetical protein